MKIQLSRRDGRSGRAGGLRGCGRVELDDPGRRRLHDACRSADRFPAPSQRCRRPHDLVYELLLVNGTPLHTRIDAIAAFDPATGATLGEWKGEALAAIFRLNGRMPGATLRPGGSAYAFLDASVPEGAPVPHAVKHRISVSRFMELPNDKEKLAPLDPSMGVPNVTSFEGAETAVDPPKAVVIAPPLRGKGWIAFNGCCADLQHRGSVMAFNGAPKIPERFAIDFVKLDGERRVFSGPPDRNESYADYGLPVHAVADGTVIETSDGARNASRQSLASRPGLTPWAAITS